MGIKAKWSLARAKAKLRQWERQVDKDTVESLQAYGGNAAKAMLKCTPPSHGRTTPATALRKLKQRIQKDFEGEGIEPFDDEDIFWYHDANGVLRARFGDYNGGRPSPFRVISGRPSRKMLAAMNVGERHKVEFAKGNIGEFMRAKGQYYMGRTGNTYRLKWKGVRHVTTMGAIRAEIRRRQHLAGKLMAGWRPLAVKTKVKLPAAIKASGKGTAKVNRDGVHKAVLTASNGGHYPQLQAIINRQIPSLRKKNRNLAKKRAKTLGKTLKK